RPQRMEVARGQCLGCYLRSTNSRGQVPDDCGGVQIPYDEFRAVGRERNGAESDIDVLPAVGEKLLSRGNIPELDHALTGGRQGAGVGRVGRGPYRVLDPLDLPDR